MTNGQLSLEDSGIVINKKILSILTKLLINKDRVFINANLAFNITAFKYFIDIISIPKIKLIKKK